MLIRSPGNRPNPEIEPRSPALQSDSLPAEPPGTELQVYGYGGVKKIKISIFFSMSPISTLFRLFKLPTVMHSHYSHIFSI